MKYVYPFPRPSVTATIAVIVEDTKQLLVATRGPTTRAYPNCESLPGGFLNAKFDISDVHLDITDLLCEDLDSLNAPGETVEQTAVRELREETGIVVEEHELNLACVISDPDIDPRCHVVNVCYYVLLTSDRLEGMAPADDVAKLELVDIIEFVQKPREESAKWAFNHYDIAIKVLSVEARRAGSSL